MLPDLLGVGAIGERERQVIVGLYWEGKTEGEIAHELGISQRSARLRGKPFRG